jgi:S-adenosylmethionine decarboxylase
MAICPRGGMEVDHTGKHLLLDLYGASHLADVDYIQKACEEAAVATGATIIGSHFHPFGEGNGVSGVVILAESHLSIHTWPEFGVATIDCYVCGSCDPTLATPVLKDKFKAETHKGTLYRRGILDD